MTMRLPESVFQLQDLIASARRYWPVRLCVWAGNERANAVSQGAIENMAINNPKYTFIFVFP
jgi:hypothetical protein